MLLNFDAKALEWRIPVEFSRDPTAIEELRSGQDIHSLNQRVLELPDGPPGRLAAKVFLFRTIFRGSGWAYARDNDFMHVSTDPDFWDDRIEKFFQKYKDLNELHRRWIQEVHLTGKIEGPLGRFWTFEKREKKGQLEYSINDITNYPVQGTGNDLMAIARVSLKNRLTKYNIPAIIVSTVHDSIVLDLEQKYIKDVVEITTKVFEDIPQNVKKLFKYEWIVPIPCEAKAGPNLMQMENIA